MKQTWPIVKLGEVLHHRKVFITIEDEQMYMRPKVKLHAQGIELRDHVSGSEIKTKKQQVCRVSDFLVAEIDAKMGGFGIVPIALDKAIVSSHYFLFESNQEHLIPDFLGYYCKTKVFRDQVAAKGTTNYAAIRAGDVLEYVMPLPPIEEQQRIIARIGTVRQQLQDAVKLRSTIEVQLQSLFLSLHSNSGTTCKLGDLIELYEDKVRIQPTESYPQVGVRGFGGGLFPKAPVFGTETTYKTFNRLYEDAIVLSQVKGWEGAIAVCPRALSGMYVSPEYRTFRCKPNIASPRYMQEVVRSQWFWKYLQEATRGVGARRERVRPEKFLAIDLHMPSFSKQEKIVATLNGLETVRQLRTEVFPCIEALLPSLLQKEMSQAQITGV
ncbi:restriction endonuclease subunit S [Undibacterium sp. TC9W]|uniref:restriction endonuclease subunit S n=1 Tax=Undibacterium sp. TC9W TaxID=3413053 RepID=UPI003BF146A3